MIAATLVLATLFVYAQVVTVTITNSTIYVAFRQAVVLHFNATTIRVGWLNSSILRVVYFCVFSTSNYSEECIPTTVIVYDPNTSQQQVVSFTDLQAICFPSYGFCRAYADLDVGTYMVVRVKVVNARNGEVLADEEVPKIPFTPYIPAQIRMLISLLPIAILIGLAMRGSVKMCALGLILYGALIPAFAYLGFEVPNSLFVSTIAIIVGIMMLFFTR